MQLQYDETVCFFSLRLGNKKGIHTCIFGSTNSPADVSCCPFIRLLCTGINLENFENWKKSWSNHFDICIKKISIIFVMTCCKKLHLNNVKKSCMYFGMPYFCLIIILKVSLMNIKNMTSPPSMIMYRAPERE